MTVRDFINKHPDATLGMLTPGGYVSLTPEKAKALLDGENTSGHPGDPEMPMRIKAEELLPQHIISSNFINDVWHMMTAYVPAELLDGEERSVPMTREEVVDMLTAKLDACYEAYRRDMVNRGAETVFENAAEIHYNQQVYDELANGGGYPDHELEYLLRFKDPLKVVREQWEAENEGMPIDGISHALWRIADTQDAEVLYELDEAYIPNEQEPEQQMG